MQVQWTLGSITANKDSGGDGIPVSLFQILKYDAVKMLYSICQQTWKTQKCPQDWNMSVFIPTTKKGNAKACSNYHTIALISHVSQVMLEILQASSMRTKSSQMFKLDLEKAEERSKAIEFQKNIYFCFIDYAKTFNCVDHNKLENSSTDGNTRPPYLLSEKSVCRSRSNS